MSANEPTTAVEPVTTQPLPTSSPDLEAGQDDAYRTSSGSEYRTQLSFIKQKVTTKYGWLGDYDYAWLCLPSMPFSRKSRERSAPPFYGLDDELPLLLAIANGFQHSLAMLAGKLYFKLQL